MNEIAAYDPDIRRILNMEEAFVKTPELWVDYLIREREQSDWDNYVRNREARGKAEGIASTARRMLALNFTSEQISQATGLSLEEVESLRSN